MARLVLCAVLLFVAGGFCEPLDDKNWAPAKIADQEFLKKQTELLSLYYHVNQPAAQPYDLGDWTVEKNIENFKNVTAVKVYTELMESGMTLPRSLPFSIFERSHQFEAITLFNVLFSAKDYSTLYKAAVYFRERVNEGMFVYVLAIVTIHHPETQGIMVPPFYNVFPSYFNNGEIMACAQRINTHGKNFVEKYPWTYLWNDNVVIRWNYTTWAYYNEDWPVQYFTHDFALNSLYYNNHLTYPFWLSGETAPFAKFQRGEYLWFFHKQILALYYMARLANDLGEIPELGMNIVKEGYSAGLVYPNGVPFPTRPNHFTFNQPEFAEKNQKIKDFESRIREAIDLGYFIDSEGKRVSLRTPESIAVLGDLIQANADSANPLFFGDFIQLWKTLLSNSYVPSHQYKNGLVSLVLPGALENYQTALRDPAFYMIWKRVLQLFYRWQSYLPVYKPEELALPSVTIENVEVDNLVSYFEHVYLNVTNELYMNEWEGKAHLDEVSVLVERAQLTHKPYEIRVKVKSDVAKKVVVRFFLAPKFDSKGYEIPLHKNTENFFLWDQFIYELPVGECEVKRQSTENRYTIDHWTSFHDLYEKANKALHGNGQFVIDSSEFFDGFPNRLTLPKGRYGGMPFVFMVFISEYLPPKKPFGTGFNPTDTYGIGTGSHRMTRHPLGYPLDRPLYQYQVQNLKNMHFQDVYIHHKPMAKVVVPHAD